jgi:hypothetical protein
LACTACANNGGGLQGPPSINRRRKANENWTKEPNRKKGKIMQGAIECLECLVRELIEDGVDRIALNKMLGILHADEDPLEEMERLVNFWWETTSADDPLSYCKELISKLRSLTTMSPTELDAVRWFDECLDCRARTHVDLHESYRVLDHVWCQAVPDGKGRLCVGCLEERLGRRLTRDDFDHPDWLRNGISARLKDRVTVKALA